MTQSNDKVHIGIVGAGGMGRLHAACYRAIDGVNVVGVHDIDPKPAKELADELGTTGYASVEMLIDEAQPEVLDVCTPSFAHKEPALQAATAGIDVFCEKPIARTVEDAQAMVDACRHAGVHLCIGHVVRFYPDYTRARQAVLEGQIGQPALVDLSRQAAPPKSWYRDFERSGGVVVDMMIHDLDWLRWVFGEVARVYAQGSTFRGEDGPDWALATLRLTSGVVAHVLAGWNAVGGFRTAGQIVGDQGLLTFDNVTPPLTIEYVDPPKEQPHIPPAAMGAKPHCVELCHFVDVVRGQAELIIPPEDALAALKLSLAVLESIKTGEPMGFRDATI